MISAMSSNYMSYLGSDHVPGPLGASFRTVVPYTVFSGARSRLLHRRRQRKAVGHLLPVINRADLMKHPDFANNPHESSIVPP